jgi:hypothetical protein
VNQLRKLFIGSILCSLFGFYLVNKESKIINWIIFTSGIIGLILSVLKLLFPNSRTFMNYEEKNKLDKKSFQEIYNDEGIFEFYGDGFYIDKLKNPELIEWKKIKTIITYKKDLFATDLIIVEIITDKNSYKINEETAGWYYFVDQINKTLNIVDKNWNINVANPAFEQNLMLIYDSDNRNLEEYLAEK